MNWKKVLKAEKQQFEKKGKKPDFLDLDKDGNKTESMREAAKDAKIKKAQLPEKLGAGTPITNEYKQQMDAWAKEYNNKLVGVFNKFGRPGNHPLSSWCKIDPATKQITWNSHGVNRTYSYDEFANELKACLRAVVYNQFPSNYAYDENDYLQNPESYVGDMMSNSTASLVFGRYLKK
jgi:hypothetical protein